MSVASRKRPAQKIRVRSGCANDLDALDDLEEQVFASDRMSRRSLRRFLGSPTANVLVVERAGCVAGCAVVLFRPNSAKARLYSIAVAPSSAGCGLGSALLQASEKAARARNRAILRLEVHEKNGRAISRYCKAGYRQFGCHHHYYDDRGNALRFEKRLG